MKVSRYFNRALRPCPSRMQLSRCSFRRTGNAEAGSVIFVLALSFMLWISPRLTAYALIPMVILPPVVMTFARVIHARFEQIQEQFSTLSTMVQENLTGIRVVRAFARMEARPLRRRHPRPADRPLAGAGPRRPR